jgi:GNAT superfamily N-acetyltransferase
MDDAETGSATGIVRAGRRTDLPELAKLWESTTQPDGRFLLRRYFDDVASGVQQVLVGEVEGRIKGQIWIRFRGSDPKFSDDRVQCYLHTLFVHPDSRRRGLGLALVQGASRLARDHGRRELVIAVDQPNRYARELYGKWGFAEFAHLVDLRGDLILMSRGMFGPDEAEHLIGDTGIEFFI